jgi:hypothetical protein
MTDTTEISEAPKKRGMSEEKAKQLQAAREKALEKRRMLAELTKKEKQMKQDALNERIAKVKQYEEKKVAPEEAPPPPRKKEKAAKPPPKKPPTPVESSESEESEAYESESSDESVEYIPVRKSSKVKTKYAKPKRERATSELTAQIAKEELQRRIARENMEIAFKSLFPNHSLMY